MKYRYVNSKIGPLMLAGNKNLEQVHFPVSGEKKAPGIDWVEDNTLFPEAATQINDYFKGKLKDFNLNLDLKGTDFQKQVWRELLKIPYGTTTTYGEIAKRIKNPKASRAVGLANGKNPIPIIIPCHRVIGKDGTLTGFGGGLEAKQTLLDLEKS